jgi:hypothetical protein
MIIFGRGYVDHARGVILCEMYARCVPICVSGYENMSIYFCAGYGLSIDNNCG